MMTMLNKWRPALSRRGVLYLAIVLVCLALLGLRLGPALPVNAWSVAYARLAMNDQVVLDVLPDMPKAHRRAPLWLAQEAVTQGSPERAFELMQSLAGSPSSDVLRIQGKAFFALGEDRKAISAWESAGDYQSLAHAATLAEAKGVFDTAELSYRAAWRANPTDGTLPLSNFLWRVRGDPGAAENILRTSLASYDTDNLNWLRALGLVLQAQSRWDEAIAVYQQALYESPDDLYTLYLTGLAYANGQDDYDRAQGIFERMISLAPSQGSGYFAMGQLKASEAKPEEADRWFVQAIDRNPDNPWPRLVRANTLREAQNLSLSLEVYERTVRLFPDYAAAYYEMAWAYRLNDQAEQAVASIRQALTLIEPPNVYYYLRAGWIYEWAGDDAGALQAYRQALLIDPQNAAARQGVETLTK